MLVLLGLHALAALAAPGLVGLAGRRAFLILAAAPAAAAAWALTQTATVRTGDAVSETTSWVPSLEMDLTFRLDTLAWLMTLIIGGIGALVLVYCSRYFDDDEPGLGRFAGCFVAFAGVMYGLVVADDMLVLYLFWELTTIFSYLLIGHLIGQRASRAAAMQALVVTTAGGLAMLVGIVLLGQLIGSYRLSDLLAADPKGGLATAGILLMLVGAIAKSALIPLHFWLPGAMAAPTPVSAYLHAAAMVKAGIYLIARLAPSFADVPGWRPTLLVLGALTMLVGGWRALRQYDLKLLLAYGTVSQLGFIAVLVGAGTYDAALAGLTLLAAHAMFKAALFLTVGIVDHSTGTRDLRELSGLGRRMPVLAVAAGLAVASMAGLPPLLGFVSKETAFDAFLHGGVTDLTVLAVLVLGSALTFAYGARFLWGAFATRPGAEALEVHTPSPLLVGGPVFLAALGLLAGPLSARLEPFAAPYVGLFEAGEEPATLALWHGLTPALALSAVTVLLGSVLFLLRERVEAAQRRVPAAVDADRSYRATMRGLDRASLEVTGGVQRGSLPLSLGVILLVLVALPGGALLLGVDWPDNLRWWDTPAQLLVAVLVVAAALAAVNARRRLRAVLLVGVTGYGTAFLFLLHGAPDLALTQVLVETVTLVVFVLVLRRLSPKFNDSPPGRSRVLRAALGLAVGLAVTGIALMSAGARTAEPASADYSTSALDRGGGKNIVNVTLVDIRAWDTMGELSVLLVAATGVASLVFLRRSNVARSGHEGRIQRPEHVPVGAALTDPSTRSTIFEIVSRLVFPTVVLYSLFLLFSGHNAPGGGFAAGLMVGLALVVRYLAGGRHELLAAAPIPPGLLLGIGLFLSAGIGLVSMLFGGAVLQSYIVEFSLPLLGEVKLVTSLFFDVGVYLVVIGLMLDVLRALGGEVDAQTEAEEGATEEPALPDPVPRTTYGAVARP